MPADGDIKPLLNIPQARFLVLPHKFRAFVGGFGSGKTWVGCASQCKHFWEFPRINAGYFAPTYPQIRDIFYPTMDEVAFQWGLNIKVHESNKEVAVFNGRVYRGTVICRSMEKPNTIVGFKIGRAMVDEIDLMSLGKAQAAWRKIIARLRANSPGLLNGVDVATTPEGFNFVHDQFVKQVRDKPAMADLYGMVQASTYENEANLPDGYIDSLLATYPANLIQAYLDGLFVNLKSGTVYHQYDRVKNGCNDTISHGDTLHIGMDFNVGQMAAVVHIKRDGMPRAVDEIVKGHDTPDMIRMIKERYWRYEDGDYKRSCEIRVYPDASGDSRKSVKASTTDLDLLRQAGFTVKAPAANPPVKNRVNSMNAMFHNAKGERRYLVNAEKCPTYADGLEQQPWDKHGEPDKKGGLDHPNDAAGYFIHHEYPIHKPVVVVQPLRI